MARKPIPPSVQTNVLVQSRRRCCICYGLNRDATLKAGQIAHVDNDSSNSAEDNLAFLCLEHHDEYDSRTSQRKGLTIGEVKQFRSELHDAIGKAFSLEVHFGNVTVPKEDPYAGQFIRIGTASDSADIKITPIEDGLEGSPRYAVTGFALWGRGREYGPNMGEMSFIGTLVDGEISYSHDARRDDEPHTVTLTFDGDRLFVTEENWIGTYGMNVHFMGEYQRAE
ncbi:hypothetical protein [Phenylobacterium sp.]|uniref:hypothetical protein n=1 Tax=Phenylobacterium sp. TaxID=1871053 RepID=UPI0027347423|nr:hypothetical protein [Phenylobacterium sp.]MDP3852915.1 hypothetical protein [Phenylobacterium sp.]